MASARTLPGLQNIRAVAAMAVVFCHISGMMGEPKYYGKPAFANLLTAGSVGVDLFFCLSGFIIVHIALDTELIAKIRADEFFKRRFERIIPFMWVMVIAYAALRLFGRGYFPAGGYLRALTLFPLGTVEPSPIWTLRHEFLFYAIFALTLLSGRRWLFWVWVGSPLLLFWVDPHSLLGFLGSNINLLFGAGVVTGMLYVTRFNRIGHHPVLLTALTGLVFLATMGLRHNRYSVPALALIALLSCAALLVATGITETHSRLSRLGKTLGDASYAIYLSHEMFISAMLGLMAHHFRSAPGWAVVAACALVAMPAGVAIHLGIEKRIIRFSKRLLERNPNIPQLSPAASVGG